VPTVCAYIYVLWSYVNANDHGLGPSPGPTSRHIHIYTNLKTLMHIYTTRNRWRCNGRRRFVKSLHSGGGLGVEPRGLPIILHSTNEPISGCHVAAHDWATWHPIIAQKTATCRHLIRQPSTNQKLSTSLLPHHHTVCMTPAMSACTNCTDCTFNIKFFTCLT
jgi:hypothetical protein